MEFDSDESLSSVDSLDGTLEPSRTMHFVLQTPLLQHIALVKIMAHLWTLRDIFTPIMRFPVYAINQGTREWAPLEGKVKKKIWALPLPAQCIKQLLNLLESLGTEIIHWCHYHCKDNTNFQFLEKSLPQHLRWTMHGTIDYKKTAELIVKEEILDVERRYEIACVNCLEDEARELLFESMGELQRQEYIKRVRNTRRMFDHHYLIVYFTCTLIGDVDHLHNYFEALMSENELSFHCCLFLEIAGRGNRATCEYLFGKLDQNEKERVLEKCGVVITSQSDSRQANSRGSLLYYLSQMNEAHRSHALRAWICDLVLCLLRWPLQSLIVEAAECAWQLMNTERSRRVLRPIIFKITHGAHDYDYVQLFRECWRLCRPNHKKRFLRDDEFLGDLLGAKREELTELVLNDASSQQVLLFCNKSHQIRRALMDESAMSDDALLKCKQTAALSSSKEPEDEVKQKRSRDLSRFIDIVMDDRMVKRSLSGNWVI